MNSGWQYGFISDYSEYSWLVTELMLGADISAFFNVVIHCSVLCFCPLSTDFTFLVALSLQNWAPSTAVPFLRPTAIWAWYSWPFIFLCCTRGLERMLKRQRTFLWCVCAFFFSYSWRMDTLISTLVGMLIFSDEEEILQRSKHQKIVLSFSSSTGCTCSGTKHSRTALIPKLFISKRRLQKQMSNPKIFPVYNCQRRCFMQLWN